MAIYKDIEIIINNIKNDQSTWADGLGRSWWAQSVQLKDNIVNLMKDAPNADVVEVKHGYWINCFPNLQSVKCSACSKTSSIDSKYCPNCGAKMDGNEEK